MKSICAATASLALATTLPAAPLAVGAVADDVGFAEGTDLSGGVYQRLEPRHLSDFPNTVIVLVYFTPA